MYLHVPSWLTFSLLCDVTFGHVYQATQRHSSLLFAIGLRGCAWVYLAVVHWSFPMVSRAITTNNTNTTPNSLSTILFDECLFLVRYSMYFAWLILALLAENLGKIQTYFFIAFLPFGLNYDSPAISYILATLWFSGNVGLLLCTSALRSHYGLNKPMLTE